MGQVKKQIRELSKDAGGKARAKGAAESWFEDSKKSFHPHHNRRMSSKYKSDCNARHKYFY